MSTIIRPVPDNVPVRKGRRKRAIFCSTFLPSFAFVFLDHPIESLVSNANNLLVDIHLTRRATIGIVIALPTCTCTCGAFVLSCHFQPPSISIATKFSNVPSRNRYSVNRQLLFGVLFWWCASYRLVGWKVSLLPHAIKSEYNHYRGVACKTSILATLGKYTFPMKGLKNYRKMQHTGNKSSTDATVYSVFHSLKLQCRELNICKLLLI